MKLEREEAQFWVLLVLLTTAGVLLVVWPKDTQYKEVAQAIGHALIIAALLAVTVDVYLKKRLYREITNDVFLFLLGYGLPEEVQDRLSLVIHQCRLLRRDSQVHFRLDPIPVT